MALHGVSQPGALPVNLRDVVVPLAIGFVATGLVVAALALFGCRPPPLPPEGPWTETVAANRRDR